MKARFVGSDGSMGFRKGKVYDVRLFTTDNYVWVQYRGVTCPYSSFSKLLENWESVDKI